MEGTWWPWSVQGDSHPTGQTGGWRGSCHGNVHPAVGLPGRAGISAASAAGPGGGRWGPSPHAEKLGLLSLHLCHHPLEESDLCYPLPITLFSKETERSSRFFQATPLPTGMLTSEQQPMMMASLMAAGRGRDNSGTNNAPHPRGLWVQRRRSPHKPCGQRRRPGLNPSCLTAGTLPPSAQALPAPTGNSRGLLVPLV